MNGFDPWVGKIPWRRSQQPTPVFLPGESHGQRSLAVYSPWGHKGSGTIEDLESTKMILIIINLLIKYVNSKAAKAEVQPSHYSQKKNNTFSDSFQKFLHLNYLKALHFVEGSLGKINS